MNEHWKSVAMVVDRVLLCIFTVTCIGGSALILLQSPSLTDTRPALDEQRQQIVASSALIS